MELLLGYFSHGDFGPLSLQLNPCSDHTATLSFSIASVNVPELSLWPRATSPITIQSLWPRKRNILTGQAWAHPWSWSSVTSTGGIGAGQTKATVPCSCDHSHIEHLLRARHLIPMVSSLCYFILNSCHSTGQLGFLELFSPASPVSCVSRQVRFIWSGHPKWRQSNRKHSCSLRPVSAHSPLTWFELLTERWSQCSGPTFPTWQWFPRSGKRKPSGPLRAMPRTAMASLLTHAF